MLEQKWDLDRLGAGDRAELRRAAGQDVSRASVAALHAFYKACGYCDPRKERYWFPAMCMDALWRSTDEPTVKPFPECLRDLIARQQETSESIRHRVDMLLEMPWEDDGFLIGKTLNMVKIIKSKTDLKPDFQLLADDFSRWSNPRRYVQRNWLRTLYNVQPDTKNKEEESNAD